MPQDPDLETSGADTFAVCKSCGKRLRVCIDQMEIGTSVLVWCQDCKRNNRITLREARRVRLYVELA